MTHFVVVNYMVNTIADNAGRRYGYMMYSFKSFTTLTAMSELKPCVGFFLFSISKFINE